MRNFAIPALVALALPALPGCLPPLQPQPVYSAAAAPPPQVTVTAGALVLNQAIFFEFDQDRILPISYPILDELARTLQEHPEIARVRIEGHTDNVGSLTYNLNLSGRRAQAVQRYLEHHGAGRTRLRAVGFGQSQPIADNASEEGRARNRRVSFVIEGRDGDAAPPRALTERAVLRR